MREGYTYREGYTATIQPASELAPALGTIRGLFVKLALPLTSFRKFYQTSISEGHLLFAAGTPLLKTILYSSEFLLILTEYSSEFLLYEKRDIRVTA